VPSVGQPETPGSTESDAGTNRERRFATMAALRLARLVALLAALSAVLWAPAASARNDPVVATQGGALSGTTLKSFLGNSYFAFKGIPYAEPPVGEQRFRLPRPHPGWSGVRTAKTHGPKCVQFEIFKPGVTVGNEDCLFANVYTPRLPSAQGSVRLPVLVWIHGGGFVSGEGDATFYGPDYLLDQQVVLVTVNYRLGPFGFFTTGDGSASGNYGLHDQTLALQWVKDNIAVFGGDPERVTIFGESAGGASIGLQVLSPRARGLFSGAISQSGASMCSFAADGEVQGEVAQKHAALLGCDTSSSDAIVDCLRKMSVKDIMATMNDMAVNTPLGVKIFYKPRVDTEAAVPFLPEDPYVALREGHFNRVPWMNGFNHDEGVFNIAMMAGMAKDGRPPYATQDWTVWSRDLLEITKVAADPEAVAEQIYRFYLGDDAVTEDNLPALVQLFTDRGFGACVSSEIELASAHTPVYKYIFDHTGAGRQSFTAIMNMMMGGKGLSKDLGVGHADDLFYLFRPMFAPPVAANSAEHNMIKFMVSIWTNFARNGYPSQDVVPMPSWPAFTPDNQQHMQLNDQPTLDRDAFSERLAFWKQLNINENWRKPLSGTGREEL